MKSLNFACPPAEPNPSQPPLHRGGAKLALPLFEAGPQQSCGAPASIPLAGARGSWRGFSLPQHLKSIVITTLLLAGISTANADTLGRLFFTPEQRQQLDMGYLRNATADGNSAAVLTVNGIVQKTGGARTVWVNGVSHSPSNGNERNPTTQTVIVPGKSQPVKLKVGDKLLLDQPTPAPQEAPAQ